MGENEEAAILKALTEFRVEVARAHGEFATKIGSMANHEGRIANLERHILKREDVEMMLKDAIDKARRPSWRDLSALVAVVGTFSYIYFNKGGSI